MDSLKDAYFGKSGVYGGFSRAGESFQNGNVFGGLKNIADGIFSFASLTPIATAKNIYNVFKPQKENDKSIIQETEEQIQKVSELRDELNALTQDRKNYSTLLEKEKLYQHKCADHCNARRHDRRRYCP